jgi:CheY-like chemotaxis protein
MNFNALVAEPRDAAWAAIAKGVRRHFPDASLLRVKDGEQALRFLLQRGLLTDDPETPDVVLLAAELQGISMDRVFARLRQDSRTRAVPVILRWHDLGKTQVDVPDLLLEHGDLVLVRGPEDLEAQVADAVYRLCRQPKIREAEASEAG